jgi:hypothetical protein
MGYLRHILLSLGFGLQIYVYSFQRKAVIYY